MSIDIRKYTEIGYNIERLCNVLDTSRISDEDLVDIGVVVEALSVSYAALGVEIMPTPLKGLLVEALRANGELGTEFARSYTPEASQEHVDPFAL